MAREKNLNIALRFLICHTNVLINANKNNFKKSRNRCNKKMLFFVKKVKIGCGIFHILNNF